MFEYRLFWATSQRSRDIFRDYLKHFHKKLGSSVVTTKINPFASTFHAKEISFLKKKSAQQSDQTKLKEHTHEREQNWVCMASKSTAYLLTLAYLSPALKNNLRSEKVITKYKIDKFSSKISAKKGLIQFCVELHFWLWKSY